MFEFLQSHLLLASALIAAIVYVGRWLAKGYAIRARAHKMPGPPHSMLWGHLKVMAEVAAKNPRRVHPHVYPAQLRKKYNLGSYFVMDTWPVGYDSIIAIMDPEVCQQLSVEHTTLKHPSMKAFMVPLVGEGDMISADGHEWNKWRKMFNPGFSSQHLMSLVPGMVDDVLVYIEKLNDHAARKQVFRLEEDTTRLTVDVIGKVTLDLRFNLQRTNHPCIVALREQINLLPNEGLSNPFEMWHPVGIYRRWRNQRIMVDYIGKVLDERYATAEPKVAKAQKKRSILDLALNSYTSGATDLEEMTGQLPKMDAEFRKGAITQIRAFLFAGHDTTSSTICYVFYLLRKYPEVYRKVCEEHERFLGPTDGAAEAIKDKPHLLNSLEYTLCVIKETLRLFPAASAPRKGEPGLMIRDPKTGETMPTEGHMLWLLHFGLHRDENVWGETANDFIPDRFLPENSSKIPEGAWRPFEMGQRNCLGQNLALLESRIILALTCRQFQFDLALDRLDELKNDGSFYARSSKFQEGVQNVQGEEMYQILLGAAKPREGMPVVARRIGDWRKE
ncbi:Cytochrome P450 monooxygenase [Fulvia fulva]|uniref:Cytochrome P450 monooxygenase n=1 Tax=Passalora fulva TaxID=5499 RepID=A0A9Q8PAH9_PASFU|nr:Cytochrome P450 monooxygenase [Fulvia fulva]KAK4621296.1 Cytochrome P450 monooxygenase [Fulvia fulva]KAK4623180.1 Cytochrome P450 monooxygenase [Fulvia fulva]UJO18892.1 Cytochrome P450 monooxygenase [Fulvia fulva]WPV16080.1 Cytochrome P450 monooxygenase [Fulvia fulva]WPV30912.1 Cytochrome P450 monooxygenase [Fulvia fulva]